MTTTKRIEVTIEMREQLLQAFKISKVSIYAALAFKTNNDRAKRIRQMAMNLGGVIWEKQGVKYNGVLCF